LNKYKAGVPHGAVYCGRGSPYGNPFVIGRDGDRDQVCERFEREVLPTLDVSGAARARTWCASARPGVFTLSRYLGPSRATSEGHNYHL
jgi:hypothetical protein